jgi:hypothetical protein
MSISKIKDMSISSNGGFKTSEDSYVNIKTIGTFANPARSAQQLYDLGIRDNGLYWLKPDSWQYPAQFYCEMLRNSGGWIYILQKQCTNGNVGGGPAVSSLTAQFGTQNHATSDFHGVVDSAGNAKTPQDIWNAFIGAGNNGKIYVREIQTSGFLTTAWDESQRYVTNTDTAIFSWTNFTKMFTGNHPTSQVFSGIRVYYDHGKQFVDGKVFTSWGDNLATINNGNIDQDLWFMNGRNGNDSNWSFALTKGGKPYPRLLPYSYGGNRNNITRWAIFAIKA